MISTLPVLIVGAGPAGLAAALSLSQNGVPVRIIDKRIAHSIGFRGAGIQPRTLELYKMLDSELYSDIVNTSFVFPPMRQYGLPPNGSQIIKESRVLPLSDPTPDKPHRYPLMLHQSRHEGFVWSVLERKYSTRVELQSSLESLEQFDDHVVVRIAKDQDNYETASFAYVIGADGAKGIVRKLLGLSFVGESPTAAGILGDIHIEEGLDDQHQHCWGFGTKSKVVIYSTGVEDIFTLFILPDLETYGKDLPTTKEDFVKLFYAITHRTDIKFGEMVFLTTWRPNIRMVETFQKGRVFLAGDAAHVHSPTGGQGLNSSIQDSLNLAWKLALCYHGHSPPSLLHTYSAERIPVITHMLAATTALFRKEIVEGAKDPTARGGSLLMLGINYRGSPIVIDERNPEISAENNDFYDSSHDGLLCAGDRAPDAPDLEVISENPLERGTKTRLFDVFRSTYHTILLFNTGGQSVKRIFGTGTTHRDKIHSVLVLASGSEFSTPDANAGIDTVLLDTSGYAYTHYMVTMQPGEQSLSTAIIVRPDGYIGAVITKGVEGIHRYFSALFGA